MVRKRTIGRLIIYSNRTDTSYNCRDVAGMLTEFSEGLVHRSQLQNPPLQNLWENYCCTLEFSAAP